MTVNANIVGKIGLEIKGISYKTSEQFIKGLPTYEFSIDNINVKMSECDWDNGEDLREKELIHVLMSKEHKIVTVMISYEFIRDIEGFKDILKSSFEKHDKNHNIKP